MQSFITIIGMDEIQKQPKQSKVRRFLYAFGKLVLDATKLCFGSLVLGTVIRGDFPQSTVLIAGIIASSIGAIIGITLVVFYEEK